MEEAQIVAIVFIVLFLVEAIENFKLKKLIREFLEK